MSEAQTETENHLHIDPYEFAALLDLIEDESDEMYVSARILDSKTIRGRRAIEEKNYEEMNRLLYELEPFIKIIGLKG